MLAVFPGSFDPPTLGHLSLITRAAGLCDKLIVAAIRNDSCMFSEDTRLEMLQSCCLLPNVEIEVFSGLLVDCVSYYNADVIIRGVRSLQDLSYENNMAAANRIIGGGIETLFLPSLPEYSHISSSLVKDILVNNGDVTAFLPKPVIDMVSAYGS